MTLSNHRRGLIAEYGALIWLVAKGYWPVATRYKTPIGEIDLIVRRGGTLVFVEVKARHSLAEAAEAIHTKNQARVVRAAQHYLQSHAGYARLQVRFDAVIVAWYSWPKHLQNAFQ